jgi:hypothetical protein
VSVRALEARIRAALEAAVKARVSTVTVDRAGQVLLSDPLTAAHGRVRGDVVAAWTFAPEPWERVTEDEVEYAVTVLVAAWEASQE